MSKNCKMNCGCGMENENERNYFYTAVIDVETKFGTVDNMVEEDKFRYFNEKFVDSPELALMVAVDIDRERWKCWDKDEIAEIMKDVVYDPKNSEYVLKRVFTSNWNTPTENQYKKFLTGDYKFYIQTFYIQILKTDLVHGDRKQGAIDLWHKKLENTCE